MNKKVQLALVSIISFLIGGFVVNYFNNSQKKTVANFFYSKNVDSDERAKIQNKLSNISRENGDIFSLAKNSLNKMNTLESAAKNVDYVSLLSQVKIFDDLIAKQVRSRFELADLEKKVNAGKKYILESNLSELFIEKKFVFKASLINNENNDRRIFTFSFCDCSNWETQPLNISLENSCYKLNAYSYVNKKWYQTKTGGSYTFADWMGDRAYTSIFADSDHQLVQDSNIVRMFIPRPAKSDQVIFLKYSLGKFTWEEAGELEWQSTTKKEVKEIDDKIAGYIKNQQASEEQ